MKTVLRKKQNLLSLTVCAFLVYQPITFFVNIVLNLFVGEGFIYDTLILYLLLLFLYLKSIGKISRCFKVDVLTILLLLLMAYTFTYLFYPGNRAIMFTSWFDLMGNPLYIFIVLSFSGYLFVRHIDDLELLRRYMRVSSIVVVLTSIISFFIMNSQEKVPQYMVFSYNMLLSVTFLLVDSIEEKRTWHFFLGIAGSLMIFFAGARGTLVSLLASFAAYILFRKEKWYIKSGITAILVIAIVVLSLNFDAVMQAAQSITQSLGFNSRTLTALISGDFGNDSGRSSLQQGLFQRDFGLFGLGLYGDRAVGRGAYAHNIFIELLAQCGYVVGPILILALIVLLVHGLMSKNLTQRMLIIVFLSAGFFKLLFSGSYLNQEPSLYVLIALGAMRHSNGVCTQSARLL